MNKVNSRFWLLKWAKDCLLIPLRHITESKKQKILTNPEEITRHLREGWEIAGIHKATMTTSFNPPGWAEECRFTLKRTSLLLFMAEHIGYFVRKASVSVGLAGDKHGNQTPTFTKLLVDVVFRVLSALKVLNRFVFRCLHISESEAISDSATNQAPVLRHINEVGRTRWLRIADMIAWTLLAVNFTQTVLMQTPGIGRFLLEASLWSATAWTLVGVYFLGRTLSTAAGLAAKVFHRTENKR